jgi:hypothetical protein
LHDGAQADRETNGGRASAIQTPGPDESSELNGGRRASLAC